MSVDSRIGVDPIEEVRQPRVDAGEARLGALVAERDDADLRPRVVALQQQRSARIALLQQQQQQQQPQRHPHADISRTIKRGAIRSVSFVLDIKHDRAR